MGAGEASGDLVVALTTYAKSEQMPISDMTAEYVIQVNEAYQTKADELGALITDLNTRSFLDTGKAAAENFFNTTVGYPDLEYTTTEGIFSISNGLRGRPRAHKHTNYTQTDTYLTENTHYVTRDHE